MKALSMNVIVTFIFVVIELSSPQLLPVGGNQWAANQGTHSSSQIITGQATNRLTNRLSSQNRMQSNPNPNPGSSNFGMQSAQGNVGQGNQPNSNNFLAQTQDLLRDALLKYINKQTPGTETAYPNRPVDTAFKPGVNQIATGGGQGRVQSNNARAFSLNPTKTNSKPRAMSSNLRPLRRGFRNRLQNQVQNTVPAGNSNPSPNLMNNQQTMAVNQNTASNTGLNNQNNAQSRQQSPFRLSPQTQSVDVSQNANVNNNLNANQEIQSLRNTLQQLKTKRQRLLQQQKLKQQRNLQQQQTQQQQLSRQNLQINQQVSQGNSMPTSLLGNIQNIRSSNQVMPQNQNVQQQLQRRQRGQGALSNPLVQQQGLLMGQQTNIQNIGNQNQQVNSMATQNRLFRNQGMNMNFRQTSNTLPPRNTIQQQTLALNNGVGITNNRARNSVGMNSITGNQNTMSLSNMIELANIRQGRPNANTGASQLHQGVQLEPARLANTQLVPNMNLQNFNLNPRASLSNVNAPLAVASNPQNMQATNMGNTLDLINQANLNTMNANLGVKLANVNSNTNTMLDNLALSPIVVNPPISNLNNQMQTSNTALNLQGNQNVQGAFPAFMTLADYQSLLANPGVAGEPISGVNGPLLTMDLANLAPWYELTTGALTSTLAPPTTTESFIDPLYGDLPQQTNAYYYYV